MVKQLFTNKIILYIITLALWANLLGIVFRDVMTFLKMSNFINKTTVLEFKEIFAIATITLVLLLKTYVAYLVLSIFNKLDFISKPFDLATSQKLKRAVALSIGIFLLSFIVDIINELLHFDIRVLTLRAPENNFLYAISLLLILYYIYKNGLLIKQENDLTI